MSDLVLVTILSPVAAGIVGALVAFINRRADRAKDALTASGQALTSVVEANKDLRQDNVRLATERDTERAEKERWHGEADRVTVERDELRRELQWFNRPDHEGH